jgi:hypothetical protein
MKIKELLFRVAGHSGLTDPQTSCSPLPTVEENWHEAFIVHLASVCRPRVYVELGLYRCELFNRIVPFAEHLIGVDMELNAGSCMVKGEKAIFYHGTTNQYAASLKENPLQIDMLFIDACHSETSVWEDFWNFFPYIAPHGLILLHDAHPKEVRYTDPGYCGDAYKAIDRLSRMRDEFELMTIPIHPGLAICRKRNAQLSWVDLTGASHQTSTSATK